MIVAIYNSIPKLMQKLKRELFKKLLSKKEATILVEPENLEEYVWKELNQNKRIEVLVAKDTLLEKRVIQNEENI